MKKIDKKWYHKWLKKDVFVLHEDDWIYYCEIEEKDLSWNKLKLKCKKTDVIIQNSI